MDTASALPLLSVIEFHVLFDDGKVHRHFALLYDHPVYPA